jgi:hypothetical protein
VRSWRGRECRRRCSDASLHNLTAVRTTSCRRENRLCALRARHSTIRKRQRVATSYEFFATAMEQATPDEITKPQPECSSASASGENATKHEPRVNHTAVSFAST